METGSIKDEAEDVGNAEDDSDEAEEEEEEEEEAEDGVEARMAPGDFMWRCCIMAWRSSFSFTTCTQHTERQTVSHTYNIIIIIMNSSSVPNLTYL